MTILVKKVFISSKPTFVYLLCPPLCGPFSIQESAAGGLSYKVKNGLHFCGEAISISKIEVYQGVFVALYIAYIKFYCYNRNMGAAITVGGYSSNRGLQSAIDTCFATTKVEWTFVTL